MTAPWIKAAQAWMCCASRCAIAWISIFYRNVERSTVKTKHNRHYFGIVFLYTANVQDVRGRRQWAFFSAPKLTRSRAITVQYRPHTTGPASLLIDFHNQRYRKYHCSARFLKLIMGKVCMSCMLSHPQFEPKNCYLDAVGSKGAEQW